MRKGGITLLIVLLLLGLGVNIAAGDDITLAITYYPSKYVGANENINIRVVVSNESGKLVGNQIDFAFDNSLVGYVSPTVNTTNLDGEASTSFQATSKGGVGNLTLLVHYFDGVTPATKTETVQLQVIPYPDLILIETKDPVSDANKRWAIANGNDQTKVSVWAVNTSGGDYYYIPNLNVIFSSNNTEMGIFSSLGAVTDSNGRANAIFTTKTKSGSVNLTAKVYYTTSSYVTNSIVLLIDHDFPYNYDSPTYPNYKSEVELGTNTTISVKMLDKWGNLIENRRELDEGISPEEVYFSVEGSPSGSDLFNAAAFWYNNNLTQSITIPVDNTGNSSVILRMDQKPGINYIFINPLLATVPDKYIQIIGEAVGEPYAIEGWVNPPSIGGENPWVYTGTDTSDDLLKFTLTYKVLDKYGNGLQLKPIDIVILAGAEREDITITTNSTGHASFKYGPRSMAIRDVAVTASPKNYPNITYLHVLDFISSNPEDVVVTANPQSMASRDANPAAKSEIRAKVINAAGDGVAGQSVEFYIENIDYPEEYTVVLQPSFKDGISSNITDENGYATVTLLPGSFTQVFGDPHYDSTATGICNVKARWQNPLGGNIDKLVEVSWKNYPYLNVMTFLDSETVNVTDTVNVTIRLIGDGYKMEAKPIDVILCHDRSGSMLRDLPDRMVSAMDAAKAFVASTATGKDRTGLVSFGNNGWTNIFDYAYRYWAGIDSQTVCHEECYNDCHWVYVGHWPSGHWEYQCNWVCHDECNVQNWYDDDASYVASHYPGNRKTYSGYATVDTSPALDWDKANVTNAIDRLVPMGGTPMRYGLYKSIKEFDNYNRAEAVKAIILISDGDYNTYGDPLARGTGSTTEINYGEESTGYTILSDIPYQNLSRTAIDKNIKIFTIAYASDISSWTNNTMRVLSESTGGHHYVAPTGSDLLTIYSIIAGALREEAGVDTEVFADFGVMEVNGEEIAGNEVLTYIASVPTSTNTSKFYSKNLTTEFGYIDHTSDWNSTMKLPFTVGTMHLQDIWEGRMMFQVNKAGNIQLFNHTQPAIFFNTPEGPQEITLPDTFLFASVLETAAPGYGEFNETDFEVTNPSGTIYEWTWQRSYSGDLPLVEQYFISVDGGMSWTQVGQRILSPEEAQTETTGFFRYDIRDMIPAGGGTYTVDFRLTGRAIDAPSPRRVQSQAAFNMSGFYIWLE